MSNDEKQINKKKHLKVTKISTTNEYPMSQPN